MSKKLALLFVSSALLFSCQDQSENEGVGGRSQMQLSVNYDESGSANELTNVSALLYQGDLLSKNYSRLQVDNEGYYVMKTQGVKADKLLFIAGDHSIEDSGDCLADYSSVRKLVTPKSDFSTTYPALFYTAERAISSVENVSLELSLRRSLARLDIRKLTYLDVVIDSCVINNLATRSYLLPGNQDPIGDMTLASQKVSGYIFEGFESSIQGVTYMYESVGVSPEVSIYARVGGVKNVLSVKLPTTIERNMRYEIGINSRGVTLFTQLDILPWEEGGSVEAKPESFDAKIDLQNSVLSQGVRVSSTLDTVFVPAGFSGDFILSLDVPVETQVKLESVDLGLLSIESNQEGYLENQYQLSFRKSDMDKSLITAKLFVKSKSETQFYDRHIIVVREAYRTRFQGLQASVSENRVNYESYVDGDLFVMNSDWDISSINTYSLDDQFNWIRVDQSSGVNLVEGAFKPNDLEARGEIQASMLVVNYSDGQEEVFEIARRRYSLPVLKVGRFYWSKYNMRGNSKLYVDQIGFDQDRDDLWNYLKECSHEEYEYYAGAAYKGVSTEGLYLKNHQGKLLYENYSLIPNGHINNGAADVHCPPGYQIPSKDQFNEIVATGVSLTLPQNGGINHYSTQIGSRYRLERHLRDSVVVDGLPIYKPAHIMITDINNGESMLFTGLGHQETASSFVSGHWVNGLVETDGIMYYGVVNSKNAMALQSHNDLKTRTIRCVKSPTNFVIE
ncbi:MAG: hypothetical protein ACRC6R_02475 [Bacteroidales bacterium]